AASAATTAAAAETKAEEKKAEETKAESSVQAADSEIHIGLVNPLSGDNALYGVDQQRSMTMAFEEINAAGGVNGAKLVLDEYDDQGDPQNSARGAQKMADDENIVAMVGSSLTSCTLAIVPIIDDAGLVECVVSSSSPSLAKCSDYFFRMAVQDAQVGPQMAKAILNKGYKKILVLFSNNDYGKNLGGNLVLYAKDNGGEIVDEIEYNAADQDFSAIVTKVKSAEAEAIAICGTVTDSSLLISQMAQQGVEAYIIGATSLYNTHALEIAGDALEGVGCVSVYISTNPDEKVQEFVKKYQDKYGETPDAFAAMGYDMGYVLAAAADKAMQANNGVVDREGMKTGMEQTDYEGVTGHVTFTEDNEWERDYLTLIVKDGEFILDSN
ncbi:MAG: ABC transporter substrate-binding protein, partial [Stomatobaculum sp.]|nr:ABC transporter substrate-binding protein [Stomatobaculum sp.]